jgi:hypothetical protein
MTIRMDVHQQHNMLQVPAPNPFAAAQLLQTLYLNLKGELTTAQRASLEAQLHALKTQIDAEQSQ